MLLLRVGPFRTRPLRTRPLRTKSLGTESLGTGPLRKSILRMRLFRISWKIRPRWTENAFASPDQIDESCLYDVIWYDSWVPSWIVQNASLLNEFWTERYRNRKRCVIRYVLDASRLTNKSQSSTPSWRYDVFVPQLISALMRSSNVDYHADETT
jgi:hypothetical protein